MGPVCHRSVDRIELVPDCWRRWPDAIALHPSFDRCRFDLLFASNGRAHNFNIVLFLIKGVASQLGNFETN
jgi:hypothetical protein